uniref:Uncharacterized protein n=1 Tax=Panagrolaimus sp. ES5 TaxID=591445 RepID=A0AC34G3M7_9BILA
EVHEFVQLALERKRYDSKISGKENLDVQYVFQTYHDFNGWDSFERLFYLTQPVNDNVALILQYDYKAYNLNQTQNG